MMFFWLIPAVVLLVLVVVVVVVAVSRRDRNRGASDPRGESGSPGR
jgi:hypothetical protein